jgi:hypothetical protein
VIEFPPLAFLPPASEPPAEFAAGEPPVATGALAQYQPPVPVEPPTDALPPTLFSSPLLSWLEQAATQAPVETKSNA